MRVGLCGWVTCRMRVKNLLIWHIGPHSDCPFTYKANKNLDDMKRMELRKKDKVVRLGVPVFVLKHMWYRGLFSLVVFAST
jgi:hypothetical protein